MLSEARDLVPYALIATCSPLGLAAGVVVGQFLACSVRVVIGAAVAHRVERPHVQGVLEVLVGAALLASAIVIHLGPEQHVPPE